jgi:hypothetical protein
VARSSISRIISGCIAGALSVLAPAEVAQSSSSPGLMVGAHGTLLRHGAPYRGIGVNYYDAFLRALRDPQDFSYQAGLEKLGKHNIPFARFAATGYTGRDLELYVKDKEAYFRLLDQVVESAEKSNVGLIASLFWPLTAVSALKQEPREAWGNPQSETRKFMRTYTTDVVSRYVNSPSIWGWEFGCELSLAVDMPRPPRNSRGLAGRALSLADFQSAALEFARVVRSIDPNRILLTGNSLPRVASYHNTTSGSFAPDTEQQFASILLRDNPAPFSPICIHTSPAAINGYFSDRKVSYLELLQACNNIGSSVGKPIYVEEFVAIPGAAAFQGNHRQYFSQELSAIERSRVAMASVWVYDRKLQSDRSNITFENEHSYMLGMIAAANRRLQGQDE